MRAPLFAVVLMALTGCGARGQADEMPVEIAVVPSRLTPQPEPVEAPVAWENCEKPSYDSIGNKWWSGFTACHGDVRVEIEADSVNLRGPAVRATIRTPSCPAGEGAGGGHFDRSVFDHPFKTQLAEIKQIIIQTLDQIPKVCGGPTTAPDLLGPQFDDAFFDLADSVWLRLSAAERRKSWDFDGP